MKVIFIQNIENNKVGDIKNVSDGYARNFLIPRGYSVPATDTELKNLENKLEKLKKEEEGKTSEMNNLKGKLENITITIEAEVGPKDEEGRQKLFGSLSNSQISEELAKKNFQIDKKSIEIGETIKELGEYEILVKLGHGVEAKIPLKVVSKP